MKLLTVFCIVFAAAQAALLGIDYGQDYLKSALIAPGIQFEIVLTLETKRKEPLSIALKPLSEKGELERFYGAASTPVCSRFPDTCIMNLKTLLGNPYSNTSLIESFTAKHPGVDIVENKRRSTVDFKVASNVVYLAEEINAMVITHIKDRAQKMLKEETGSSYLTDVVLTVPSFFTQRERLALINSAKIAGFTTVKLVDDGLAVAINYASKNIKFDNGKPKQYHLIYDVGASSTKATLLSFESLDKKSVSAIEIEGYGADESLGGELFTNSIFELLKNKFIANNPTVDRAKFNTNKKSLVKLWQAAEKAKLILSANNEASASVESLYNDIDFRCLVTRQEFELINADVIARIVGPIRTALKDLDIADLDSVLLFGGSTRVPLVQKELHNYFGPDKISKNINADEAAVQGATLRGVVLSKMFRAKEFNVTEHSIYDYEIDVLNTRIPVFPKGASTNSIQKVELTKLQNNEDDFSIGLYENGKLIETDTFKSVASTIKKSVEKLSKEFDLEKCKQDTGLRYYSYLQLDESRIFSIKNVTAVCSPESNKGFFQNILKKTDADEDDTANSTSKAKATVKPKNLKLTIPFTPEYPSVKPLNAIQIDTSQRKLKDLAYKDQVRAQKTELLNSLESELYSIRSSIDDAREEIEEDSSTTKFKRSDLKILKAFKELVTEYLDWLEDQTYNLKNVKTSSINKKIDKINIISDFLNNPVKVADFISLSKVGEQVHQQLKSLSEALAAESEQAARLYLSKNFTREAFEKDNQKVSKTALLKIEELNVEKEGLNLFEQLENAYRAIKQLEEAEMSQEIDDDDEVSPEEADKVIGYFLSYTQLTTKIEELQKTIAKIEKEQKRRIKLLEKLLENRIKKRKDKLEKKSSTSSTETSTSETTSISDDTNTDAPTHDEL